ncbi:CgeB family protein [Clostridium sp. ZS2-4]|uniref:CgeB family protein n=1 Tax=Clostridium sp. ZS2-4 TaxID=2987703 RepID=UPI00227D61E5|nr:glycosyltransferase [Clostridium sp. ZS2-4]MCY6353838.1 glycosyltransferase [Clostridium sp. ZS2-4]
MKIVSVLLKYDYGIPERGESGEKRVFIPALREVCDNLVPFWLEEHSFFTDRNILQKEIIDFVDKENPDVVCFCLLRDEVSLETISKLSKKYITINWFGDDQWRFDDFTKYVAPKFTYSVTIDKFCLEKYKKIGYKNVIFTHMAICDYVKDLDLKNVDYKYDISFVGGKNTVREWIVNCLRRKYNVECFGAGWQNGRVSYDEFKDIVVHSKINLNLSNSVCHDIRYITASEKNKQEYVRSRKRVEQIKGRNFEIPCFGGFQLSKYAPSIEDYFDIGKEIVVYNNIDDLELYIEYYLNHDLERRKILEAGYKRAKNYTHIESFKKVFKKIKETYKDEN